MIFSNLWGNHFIAEFNKYKDKPKQVVIDGVTVVEGSADWEAFSCKWRYYRFLEALTRNPDEFSINDLAKLIKELINPKLEFIFKELPQDDPKQRKPQLN